MRNLLEILIFTLRNFTKLPILRYLGICNVLHIWHIRAIPTYRVYRLYDDIMLLADKSSVPSGHDTSTTDICTLVGIIHLIGGISLFVPWL